MSADLDHLLSESLQARADTGTPVDAGALLDAAVTRGRRVRARRTGAAALATVAAVALGASGTVLLRPEPGTPVGTGPAVTVSTAPGPLDRPEPVDLALLPDAGRPGAATSPDLVGTDPAVVHFSVDALITDAWRAGWEVTPGVESVWGEGPAVAFEVSVARAERDLPKGPRNHGGSSGPPPPGTDVTIGDRPATMLTKTGWYGPNPGQNMYWFRWQPVDGLWAAAGVQTSSPEEAIADLLQIRFDQTRLCLLPYEPTALPGGMAVRGRLVALAADAAGGRYSMGHLLLTDGDRRLRLQAHHAPGGGDYEKPLAAGPYRVWADPSGASWTMKHGDLFYTAVDENHGAPVSQDEVLRIIGGLRIADDLAAPGTWPTAR